jgi:hypothetical protein
MSIKIVKTEMSFTTFSNEADVDYLLARLVARLGGVFLSRAGFLGQQAIEKHLKALSLQKTGAYAETHKLLKLARMAESYFPALKEPVAKEDFEMFDVFEQVGRYGSAANYDPIASGRRVAGTQAYPSSTLKIHGAWVWWPDHLQRLDRAVFNIRRNLDFSKNPNQNGLAAILEGRDHDIVALWSGPLPIRDVLTHDNAYFRAPSVEKPALPSGSQ